MSEAFSYFYRNRERYSDWQAVEIYPAHSIEQSNAHRYRSLLNFDQVHWVYLNEQGQQQGRQEEAVNLVLRLLSRRCGAELSENLRGRISTLPLPILEGLSEALLDFTSLADLESWLKANL